MHGEGGVSRVSGKKIGDLTISSEYKCSWIIDLFQDAFGMAETRLCISMGIFELNQEKKLRKESSSLKKKIPLHSGVRYEVTTLERKYQRCGMDF